MRLFGYEITAERKSGSQTGVDINTLMQRFERMFELASGIHITPDTAMRSPTVQAIVQAISRRITTLPVQVVRKSMVDGKERREVLPDHHVVKLLEKPNGYVNSTSYWLDATSWLVRYGNYYAYKAAGNTGPVRRLIPLHSGNVQVMQDYTDLEKVTYRVTFRNGQYAEYTPAQVHHARGPARDGLCGDSPVMDVAEAIALEIASERFGASFFGSSAVPGLVFSHAQGSQGFKSDEERNKFVDSIQGVYAKKGRFKSLVLPKGIEMGDPIVTNNDQAQFLQTRQYQRTVIAGAFGVPPHLVGDLSKGTYNNVEQQSLDFTVNVILPYVRIFEAAMNRDLLTDQERAQGIVIRFNLEGAIRGDFKTRQEGLNIQRQAGVISANEWREREGLNPISDEDGGDEYYRQGPSGQSAVPKPGDEPAATPKPANDDDEEQDDAA